MTGYFVSIIVGMVLGGLAASKCFDEMESEE